MAGDGDGLLPVLHHRRDPLDHDGSAEHGAVQNGADGAVGGFPHLREPILLHTLGVGGDGGALYRHAVRFGRLGGVHRHLVMGALPLRETQIEVDGVQVDIGREKELFDVAPQDAGHLIPVHLHQRGGHFDFFHGFGPP